MHRRTSLALAGTTLAGLAVAVTLGGSATASAEAPADATAIEAAVTSSPATAAVDGADYAVTDVRVAGDWASAQLEPTTDLDPATAVLQHVDGAWQVVDLGTAQVGCGLAPAAVEGDLGLVC
jgi:hypothetical protein